MVTTTEPELEHDVQALIKEARRRTRRRRALRAGFAALIAGAAALIVLIASRALDTQAGSVGRPPAGSTGGPTVALKSPGALAVGPQGTLYIVDSARDQVLRLLATGRFAVFAGSGRVGFSGDGGPATRADLRGVSTIAVGPDGTVYMADTDNNRVRAVAPDGTIRTLVRLSRPTGLAIGPHGQLYIAASYLFRMPLAGEGPHRLAGGHLQRLAGWTGRFPPRTKRELRESHFSGSYGDIAVDREGDVFVANFPQLYERTATGRLRFLGNGFRAGGAMGQLAEAPDGSVYEGTFGVAHLSSEGPQADQQIVQRPRWVTPQRRIDKAVGGDWRPLSRAGTDPLIAPAAGLAVAHNGTIYYDSDSGDGWVSGALVEITAGGHVRVLWRAPH